MILGIGTDIIEVERVKKALERKAFSERVYTEDERIYCEKRISQAGQSYAARFAAKEAFMKALGTGLRGGKLTEIEIFVDELGAPKICLQGTFKKMAEERSVKGIHLSLSHTKEYAIAYCVLEG